MAGQTINRLSALAVNRATKKGMYADGGGLYLHVSASGAKSWIYRFMLDNRPREMGLGALRTTGLAEARARALECRRLRADGIDPITARQAGRQKTQLDAAKAVTFKQCAERYIAAHQAGWRNVKHGKQWSSSLEAYA
jgi:hypothetical protein